MIKAAEAHKKAGAWRTQSLKGRGSSYFPEVWNCVISDFSMSFYDIMT